MAGIFLLAGQVAVLPEETLDVTARELRVPAVLGSAAQQILRLASSHGFGRKDYSSV